MITRQQCVEQMLKLTQKITDCRRQILVKRQDIQQRTKINKIKKLTCENAVATSVDSAGKPTYSNADKRLIQVTSRLESDKQYLQNVNIIDLYSSIIDSLQIQLSMYDYKFRSYQAYANFK